MEYVIGAAGAFAVSIGAAAIELDRDRAFYPTVLIVVASYYGLFAVMAGATPAFIAEAAVLAIFAVCAVAGFKTSLWLVAGALMAHGALDLFHGHVISNPGVPGWWPGFCASYDLVAGSYLASRLWRRGVGGAFSAAIRPFVDDELRAAAMADAAGDSMKSFRHLERAHVLSQAATLPHVRVHYRMLLWGLRYRRPGEVIGQAFRLIGAAALTTVRGVPHGNTGGTNVSAFRPMPIPQDLTEIIARASRVR